MNARVRRCWVMALTAGMATAWTFASAQTPSSSALPSSGPAPFIVMASTTSTEQSGLFAHLLPAFKQASGIEVRVVAVGTGQR